MWDIYIQTTKQYKQTSFYHNISRSNNALFDAIYMDLIEYYHTACFIPDQ